MKVETYKETYHNPVVQIPVPAEFDAKRKISPKKA
ncbi:Uncharacterised protein [Moraxella bovis]|uniref:Uncharacterized protein n=1 Tax=Moraxella bovis TaxID=476 RepID=A0A378PSQ1_MORBO|nr:Uncharacterised protein [Moraxella bovis]